MTVVLPLGVIAMVATFIIGLLGAFPLPGLPRDAAAAEPAADDSPIAKVQQAGDRLSGMYTSMVSEIASYQKDPDYRRAEATYQALRTYGESLLPQFQSFSDDLQNQIPQ